MICQEDSSSHFSHVVLEDGVLDVELGEALHLDGSSILS